MSLRFGIPFMVLVGLLGLSLVVAAEEEPEGMGMEHMALAQGVVRSLGRQGDLPADATPADFATYLQGMGIAPMRGWISGAEVSKDDLAVVTIEALGLLGEVEDPANVSSYMAVLSEREIVLTTVMDVITNVAVQTEIAKLVVYSPITILYETFLTPVVAH